MDEVLKDERFSHILTDPSFRRIPKKVRKIQIDNRFKNLLKNKRFTEKCGVDEHGCALKLDATENLKKLYNMDEESPESEDISDNEKIDKANKLSDVSKSKEKGSKKRLKVQVEKNKSFNDNFENLDNENELNDLSKMSRIENINNQKTKKNLKNGSHQISTVENRGENELSNDDNIKEFHKINSINKNKLSNISTNYVSKKAEKIEKAKSHALDSSFKSETDSEEDSSEKEESDLDSDNQDEESDNANSSDEDSESDDSESKESDVFDHQWEEQHERAPDTDEITKRLAVCHMDWDRIRAVDLYAVFNSFKPPDTSIISVKIYPSEYGLQRMEEEKLNGPCELVEKTLAVDEEEVEDKKGSKYHREKLRQYQMNRLKYYYAIVECDTPETANTLYEQLNGMEYESSSVRFDLRFVPDDLAFDQEPTSVAENPDLTEYKPKLFVTTALQQVKVGLTWDETDPQRRDVLQKAFTEPDDIEKDIKEYLASSSDESEEEANDNEEDSRKLSTKERIQKYKSLLESINEQEKEKNGEKYEMEITWEPGVKEKTENMVKEKLEEKSYTPFEELQKKKKEKQKLKKKVKKTKTREPKESEDEISNMSDSDASSGMEISNIKKKSSKTNDELYLISDAKKTEGENEQSSKRKKKKKTKQEAKDDFKVNVNDPRFSAIYTSPLFNIDPSDPHFKKTPGNLAIIAEKQRRLKNKNGSIEETKSNKKIKYN